MSTGDSPIPPRAGLFRGKKEGLLKVLEIKGRREPLILVHKLRVTNSSSRQFQIIYLPC